MVFGRYIGGYFLPESLFYVYNKQLYIIKKIRKKKYVNFYPESLTSVRAQSHTLDCARLSANFRIIIIILKMSKIMTILVRYRIVVRRAIARTNLQALTQILKKSAP